MTIRINLVMLIALMAVFFVTGLLIGATTDFAYEVYIALRCAFGG